MNANSKLSCAIAAILGSSAAGLAHSAAATDAEVNSDAIAEVIVTAQRRSENIQDVPISIRALTAETLTQLNVRTLDDYIKYLPNVSTAANGPGQNEVYMRGLAAGSQASQGSGSTGLWPNVAIYLDNQSGQLPNRNLDIYAADLNRIEVLEGPQGTLFGAGAEAGVIRYITNEPKLDVTEGSVNGGLSKTTDGNPNEEATAVLNLPLIADTMAMRAVIYYDHRGGYIDNVPATFTRKNTDIGISNAKLPADALGNCPDGLPTSPTSPFCVPPGSAVINNKNVAANDINPVTYQGARVEALYKFNDDWNALLSQSFQQMDSLGVFYQQPNASDGAPLSKLKVTLFNNSYDNDRFESTALTVNGKFGDLKAVYTGGYLVRNVDQVGDYTNYARGLYADYYQCFGPGTAGSTNALTPTCFSPNATWHASERNEHLQQEIRLSTPDEWRWRGIVGAYYEDNKLYDQTAWNYKSVPPCTSSGAAGVDPGNTGCYTAIGTSANPGAYVQNPGVKSPNTSFYQDQMRETKQTAFFLSVDYDLIPKVLTFTAGTRHYLFQNSLRGSVTGSFGCFQQGAPGATGCIVDNYNLDASNLRDTESGFKSRANLTWHITPDAMVYYTFSQGFRPGGYNQNGGSQHGIGPNGVPQYVLAASYISDKLTNNEVGWKTEWWDHRLQWNGAVYQENWNNVQVPFFDPGVVGNIFYNTNGQDFRIRGIETSVVARVTSGLTLRGGAAWNHSEQTNSPQLIDNNPLDNVPGGNYGKPITQVCTGVLTGCAPVPNPYGPIGGPTANSPPIQFSVHARYEWNIAGYAPFMQLDATHTGHSYTQAGANPNYAVGGAFSTSRGRFENPAYSTFDCSLGVAKDAWTATLYGQNIGNSNASTFISTDQFIVAQTPLRPRIVGMTMGYKF